MSPSTLAWDAAKVGAGDGKVTPTGGINDLLKYTFRCLRAATISLILVIAALFGYVLGSLRPDQMRYSDGQTALQLAHQAMIDQETGLRGYLLLHETKFLDPYHEGVAAVAVHNATVSQELGTTSDVAPFLLEMRIAEEAWTSQWALVVAQDHAPSNATALSSFLDLGKELFDSYRLRESALTSFVQARNDSLQHREGVAFGVGLAVTTAVLLVLAIVMERQRRRLRRMLIGPVDAIVATTERIANREFEARVESDGPAEFRQIGTSINHMAEALTRLRDNSHARGKIIEEQRNQLRTTLAMAREIAGSLSSRYVLRSVATSSLSVSGFPHATIWLCEDDEVSLTAAFDTDEDISAGAVMPSAEIGVGVVGHAVKFGRTTTEVAVDEFSTEIHLDRPLRAFAVPLIVGARVSGAIELSSPEPLTVAESDIEAIETLAMHAAAAIEAARLHGRVEAIGNTDALTGLANRRSFDTDLGAECERSLRYHRPLALIMFDVDHFKDFNDTFGHLRGDEALQELAATVKRELRATDTAYRYGGEEFAVLARETGGEDASIFAERLRSRIEDHFASHGTLSTITASFGIGLVSPANCRPDHLIAAADTALYEAKANGRNQVHAAHAPVEGAAIS
jgi:diguanylate cyclase (GGDEF)-like protein